MRNAFALISILTLLMPLFSGVGPRPAKKEPGNEIVDFYFKKLNQLKSELQALDSLISQNNDTASLHPKVLTQLISARLSMKEVDVFLRYADPVLQKKINGPLLVEWETEVFEKFEKPYRRVGTGLALVTEYLEESKPEKDSLLGLVRPSIIAVEGFQRDSIRDIWRKPATFFLANRLFLLNLASIYTTGFDCPDKERILPELKIMLASMWEAYAAFNRTFPAYSYSKEYLSAYQKMQVFAENSPKQIHAFDHYTFIKNHVNPLYAINHELCSRYKLQSNSMLDYSLNPAAKSIFDKNLFFAQESNGIYNRVTDRKLLGLLDSIGELLFFDPILSGNNERSCASCHHPAAFFTDTAHSTAEAFDHKGRLKRNTPSLLNVVHNQLLMQDGRFYSLQHQVSDVIQNETEMAGKEKEIMSKVLSCKTYKIAFGKLLPFTYTETEIGFPHVVSALTRYIARFSFYKSPFDRSIEKAQTISKEVINGFNLFMGKAQCGTCHFVPQFNGVKPPFTNSEFEVLGTPSIGNEKKISPDPGRAVFFDTPETRNAFRTGSVRNSSRTRPYMHNGIFKNLDQLMAFYNEGGGAGRGLIVPNQTLPQDSLHLTETEINNIIAFVYSLNEDVQWPSPPKRLPQSSAPALNHRKVGGLY